MNSTYNELTITIPNEMVEFIADYVSNIFHDGLEMGSNNIIIRSEKDITYVKEGVEALILQLDSNIKFSFKEEVKRNEDWIGVYQDSVQPVEIGSFYIKPSWYDDRDDKINIQIDPALAFGSGHHPTTFSCVEFIEKYLNRDDAVLDVGCGSGVLGLACAKLGGEVDLCDTDPISVDSTIENFELNSASYNNIWEGSVYKRKIQYDMVVANIIADVLKLISKDIVKATKDNGIMILSGILDKKEELVLKSFKDCELIDRKLRGEWVTLVYKKAVRGN
ncbi:Ribosomal protein L11 methyltransferase [hydrothermal vent metagenome]|uniref:Ribosomal protein L11 methyltransferase n=1 Tax=hydrothermal vent metagenome TaxID=652676 RepID=A0A1W1EKG0_9ZZZZ